MPIKTFVPDTTEFLIIISDASHKDCYVFLDYLPGESEGDPLSEAEPPKMWDKLLLVMSSKGSLQLNMGYKS